MYMVKWIYDIIPLGTKKTAFVFLNKTMMRRKAYIHEFYLGIHMNLFDLSILNANML